jgi:cell division transport system permease protein
MTEDKNRKRRPSALPGIIGIALVVFMLSLFGLSVLGFHGLSRSIVEGSSVDVYLTDSSGQQEANELASSLKTNAAIKKVKIIHPAEGLKELEGKSGTSELMEFVDASILPFSIEIYFHADAATPENLGKIAGNLRKHKSVESVVFNQNMLSSVHRNLRNIQLGLGILAALFTLIAVGLINNSIKLHIFSSRFLIKSMQLVGATNSFIVRPFVWKFIKYAFLSMPLAALLLAGSMAASPAIWPETAFLKDFISLIDLKLALPVFVFIALLGIFIAAMSAWFSTLKYLRTKIENLY